MEELTVILLFWGSHSLSGLGIYRCEAAGKGDRDGTDLD